MDIEAFQIAGPNGIYSRKVWLRSGTTDAPRQLCVFLDAEYYLERLDTLSFLDRLEADGRIPPLACLFVSHQSHEARFVDYTCNLRFSAFIAEDVIGWAQDRLGPLAGGDVLICGLSLSGLASAYLALAYPGVFSAALCQSGSFWWNDEWLTGNLLSPGGAHQRLWVSVGDEETVAGVQHGPLYQEVSQKEATEKFVGKLREGDATVHVRIYSGGHAIAPWNAELPDALSWLLGPTGDAEDQVTARRPPV